MTIVLIILALGFIIFIHEMGHFLAAKIFGVKVEEFGFGFPPAVFSKKIGETRYSLNLLPLGGFVKLLGEEMEEKDIGKSNELLKRAFFSQSILRRAVIVGAGVFMNIFAGWLILTIVFTAGIPDNLVVADALSGSPAAQAGLQNGDVIKSLTVKSESLFAPINKDDFIHLIRRNPSERAEMVVQRNGSEIKVSAPIKDAGENIGQIGAVIVNIGSPRHSFPQNFFKAGETAFFTLIFIGRSLFQIVSGIFVSGGEALKDIAGPLGIFAFTGKAAQIGIIYFLQTIALISLNLAVLNLFPFPALDGGRLIFLIIERLRKKPLPLKFQHIANALGFGLLILLMIIVTLKDIKIL